MKNSLGKDRAPLQAAIALFERIKKWNRRKKTKEEEKESSSWRYIHRWNRSLHLVHLGRRPIRGKKKVAAARRDPSWSDDSVKERRPVHYSSSQPINPVIGPSLLKIFGLGSLRPQPISRDLRVSVQCNRVNLCAWVCLFCWE